MIDTNMIITNQRKTCPKKGCKLYSLDLFDSPSFPASAEACVVCVHLPPIPMDPAGSSNIIVKKQEEDGSNDKRDIKPVPKTLNRVPRKSFRNCH